MTNAPALCSLIYFSGTHRMLALPPYLVHAVLRARVNCLLAFCSNMHVRALISFCT